ncbi:MAG: hypothetical protein J6B66_07485 [Anaerotignum sp.]|nr:hypothetical protein [Anaerotignum sp.]
MAEKHKTTIMKIAIAWSFTKNEIDMPVIKPENSNDMRQGMLSGITKLNSEEMRYLEEALCAM